MGNYENQEVGVQIDKYNNLSLLKNDFEKQIQKYTTQDQDLIKKAYILGEINHEGQTRDEGSPYFTHCLAVAVMAMEANESANFVCAAFLHDTLEDTEIEIDELNNIFDQEVLELITLVSKKLPGKEKLDESIYFQQISANTNASKLKGYDRLCNILSLELSPQIGKKEKYILETKEKILPLLEQSPELKNKIITVLNYLEN